MNEERPWVVMLDDLRVFHKHIVPTINAKILYLRTSEEAVIWLDEALRQEWQVTQFWFDHDLGIANGEIDDSIRVAKAIAENDAFHFMIEQVVIHTSNSVGGNRLEGLLYPIWGNNCLRVNARYYSYALEELM